MLKGSTIVPFQFSDPLSSVNETKRINADVYITDRC